MLKNVMATSVLVCAVLLMSASASSAQDARQTVNFTLGYFTPFGLDGRDDDDVLLENSTFLLFEIDDFNGASVGGEWLFPFGRIVEGGIGVNYTSQDTHSVYLDFVDPDGTEIDQELTLRMVPISFTVRLVPTGHSSPVQPYVGGGIGLINWRYSESGEFIDFGAGREIFRDTFVKSGSNVGPVVLGGVRFVGESVSGGFEVKYQKATGDLDANFAAPKIDLGGWTTNFTFGVRF
jgi:hypothetical protein